MSQLCMFAALLQELKINPDFLNRNVNEGGRNALHLFGKPKSYISVCNLLQVLAEESARGVL